MTPSTHIDQWQALHDACLAEAQTLVDVQGSGDTILSLSKTAAVCVDVLQKLRSAPAKNEFLSRQPFLASRTDLP